MLTFFRKVRKGLLGSGQARKYMLYAIGEILLVMIGILLALQVNNWNETRSTRERVKLYLINLSEAINEDIHKHKDAASFNAFRHNSFQYLLKITGNDTLAADPLPKDDYNDWIWKGPYPDTMNKEFIDLSFSLSIFVQSQNTNKTVYVEMKSMGLFSRIDNPKLKELVREYYNYCDTRLTENGDWNSRISFSWQSFLRDNYNFVIAGTQVFGDPIKLLNDPKVIVRIQELSSPAIYRVNNSYRAVSLAENLIREINKELSQLE